MRIEEFSRDLIDNFPIKKCFISQSGKSTCENYLFKHYHFKGCMVEQECKNNIKEIMFGEFVYLLSWVLDFG